MSLERSENKKELSFKAAPHANAFIVTSQSDNNYGRDYWAMFNNDAKRVFLGWVSYPETQEGPEELQHVASVKKTQRFIDLSHPTNVNLSASKTSNK